MPAWSETPVVFKIGIIGILFSFVVFIVGFGTPVWYQTETSTHGTAGYGLWQFCLGIVSDCIYTEAYKSVVIRCIEIAACAFHLSSITNILITLICTQNRPAPIAVSGIIAGVIGLAGEILFATWGIADQPSSTNAYLSWSFGLAVAGSGLVIIFSILLAISSRYISYPEKLMVHSSDQYMQELPDRQPSPKQAHHYDQHRPHLYNEETRVMPDLPRYQPAPRSQYQQPHQPAQYYYNGGKQYGYDQKY